MKTMIISILFFLSFYLVVACENPHRNDPNWGGEVFDSSQCNNDQGSRSASFDTPKDITSENASNYTFSGKCERENSEVNIYVEGHSLSKHPLCNRGEWNVTVNISGIVNKRESVQVAVSQAGQSGLLCTYVDNHFVCPDGYIAVSQREGLTREDFCVMKYEAKVADQEDLGSIYEHRIIKAESRVDGVFITRINEQSAKRACQENGAGYNLIHNNEWQTIARNIEEVDVNWSEGESHVQSRNRLNIGNISSIKTTSDDSQINDSSWSRYKRTHKLLNGEHIWDFSGNLTELVRHNITSLPVKYRDYVYNIPSEIKKLFGPEGEYSIFDKRERLHDFGGLGFIQADSFKGAVLRGGTAGSRAQGSGIFSADTTVDADQMAYRSNVGFRCVYYP